MIPKQILNWIRGTIKGWLQEVITTYGKEFASINEGIKAIQSGDYMMRKRAIKVCNSAFSTNFNANTSSDTIINFLNEKIREDKEYTTNIRTLKESFNKNGFFRVTNSLPEFLFITEFYNHYVIYLMMSGIKYNALNKDNESLNDLEQLLFNYEQKLSTFIEENLSIKPENAVEFMLSFCSYISTYNDYRSKRIVTTTKDGKDITEDIITRVTDYVLGSKKIIEEIQKRYNDEYKTNDNVKQCPISTSYSDKIKVAEELKRRKKEKEEKRINDENSNNYKMSVLKSILESSELDIYNNVKYSNNAEATRIKKDIDAALDLYIELDNKEDKDDLVIQIKEYIFEINTLLKPDINPNAYTTKPKILFFKDNNLVPRIEKSIELEGKQFYKQILSTFNKLINGNIPNIKELRGVDYHIFGIKCGQGFSLFYTKIKDMIIIIDGYAINGAFDRIKCLVQSPDFESFYNEIKTRIERKETIDESIYLERIISILSKSHSHTRKKNY